MKRTKKDGETNALTNMGNIRVINNVFEIIDAFRAHVEYESIRCVCLDLLNPESVINERNADFNDKVGGL
jgi:hypothetical protein